eukprot:TRINITY_DN5806_c6_g1_i1.p1 TRINITY_DN5806_c6_g1~~TRINITY_DN5806_c6_g1_i1.p1  ORF type:complete len:526 (+),score=145.89 TRINITY_DN5806_c6_g1_i1:86-1579(+)
MAEDHEPGSIEDFCAAIRTTLRDEQLKRMVSEGMESADDLLLCDRNDLEKLGLNMAQRNRIIDWRETHGKHFPAPSAAGKRAPTSAASSRRAAPAPPPPAPSQSGRRRADSSSPAGRDSSRRRRYSSPPRITYRSRERRRSRSRSRPPRRRSRSTSRHRAARARTPLRRYPPSRHSSTPPRRRRAPSSPPRRPPTPPRHRSPPTHSPPRRSGGGGGDGNGSSSGKLFARIDEHISLCGGPVGQRVLTLCDMGLGDEGAEYLATVLKPHNCPRLRTVHLQNNNIGVAGADAVLKALSAFGPLNMLEVGGNPNMTPTQLQKFRDMTSAVHKGAGTQIAQPGANAPHPPRYNSGPSGGGKRRERAAMTRDRDGEFRLDNPEAERVRQEWIEAKLDRDFRRSDKLRDELRDRFSVYCEDCWWKEAAPRGQGKGSRTGYRSGGGGSRWRGGKESSGSSPSRSRGRRRSRSRSRSRTRTPTPPLSQEAKSGEGQAEEVNENRW